MKKQLHARDVKILRDGWGLTEDCSEGEEDHDEGTQQDDSALEALVFATTD